MFFAFTIAVQHRMAEWESVFHLLFAQCILKPNLKATVDHSEQTFVA